MTFAIGYSPEAAQPSIFGRLDLDAFPLFLSGSRDLCEHAIPAAYRGLVLEQGELALACPGEDF